METEDMFADSKPHTLHRADSPKTSVDAAHKVSSGELLKLVYEQAELSGSNGITTKEIRAIYPDIPYSSITARPARLESDGLIHYRGDKRDGCRIMRVMEYKRNYQLCGCGEVLLEHFDHVCQKCK